ncbi:MAG: hypothetical protein DRI73_05735 [Bacteroidetes bacterium]|nr:MAG: hypothetical protein DRI73_05735 [Bacteroidota bacterium]
MITRTFNDIFPVSKPVIGMVHVPALPGTPGNRLTVNNIIEQCVKEAEILENNGLDGLIIENMHDIPYLNRKAGPEIVGMMTVIGKEIRRSTKLPCGIQILAGANKEALAAALSANIDFIRAEGFVFAHHADEGYMDSDAGELLRYRRQINAEKILIFTDIKKKHSSHAITSDVSIVDTGIAAESFLSDGLIVTGKTTGSYTKSDDLIKVKESVKLPVLVGSGITESNISDYFYLADGFIVGSWIKKDGHWKNGPDPIRIRKLMKRVEQLRNKK